MLMNNKIVVISLSTPTFNNVRAASALSYHLIKGNREMEDLKKIDFEIFSFNINKIGVDDVHRIELELNVKIHLLDQPRWYKWMTKLKMTFLRILFRYPTLSYFKLTHDIIKYIKDKAPMGIWIYGEELMRLTKCFPNMPTIVTMPDCESLYYYRLLSKRFATQRLSQILRYTFAYNQYRSMERDFSQNNILYHFVGKEDSLFFKQINPVADVSFILHPLYEHKSREIKGFHEPKVRLLVAGRNDIYMNEASNELFYELCKKETLKMQLFNYYSFTFLGKGWGNYVKKLRLCGYDVKVVEFASNYIDELQCHDIQITPISVGTGTKGKVLDAISNGLLEIGTYGAIENIAVKNKVSCIMYETASDCINCLRDILNNKQLYIDMMEKGTNSVLLHHDRKNVAEKLFTYFFNKQD